MGTLQINLSAVKGIGDIHDQLVPDHGNLCDILDGIRDSLQIQSRTIDQIGESLNNIAENGVGYDDSISVIAIPLLIGLFAFAFPFLFNAATHINSKYESKGITSMFESTLSFKLLKPISVAVVVYFVLVGFSTLFKNIGLIYFSSVVINWTGIIISSLYATLLLGIISQCFEYNKPQRLLQLIDNRYSADRKRLRKREMWYWGLWNVKKLTLGKDNKWKNKLKRDYRIKLSCYKDYYETLHDERLAELAKYSIKEKNEQLLWEVFSVIEKITIKEKAEWHDSFVKKGSLGYAQPIYKTRIFYQSLTHYYAQIKTDKNIEESILWRWLGAFSKALIPVDQEFSFIAAAVIYATEAGHLAFFDRYVDQSARSLNFIPHLSDVAFVKGCDVKCQHETWEVTRKQWRDVRELHYLMAAYLFSKRYYIIIKSLLADRSIPFERLYPIEATEVLLLYVRCKATNYGGCDFGIWRGSEIFGTDPEKDMLEKYTAAMLLLCGSPAEPVFASEKELDELNKHRTTLLGYANWIKNDSELSNLYPQIKTADFNQIYDSCIHLFEETKIIGCLEGNSNVVSLGWWQKSKFFLSELLKCRKDKKGGADVFDIFSAKLDKEHHDDFVYQIRCVFLNKCWMHCEQVNPDLSNMQKLEALGTYSSFMSKGYVISFNIDEEGPHLFHTIHRLYEDRSCYLMCSAFKAMNEILIKANHNTVDGAIKQILGDEAENFMFFDFDSHCFMYMNVELGKNKCYGADYKRVYIGMNDHMKDTELIGEFKDRLLIVRKEDMPILAEDFPESKVDVTVEDISRKEDGFAALKVNITPRYTMWYKNASYYKIEVER